MSPDPALGRGGFYPVISEKLNFTVHRLTPKDKEKPSPEVLESIIADVGVKKGSVIYVGDNRIKDISMAKEAEVTDVYAAYGDVDKESEPYQLLRKVTHWKGTSVEREKSEGDVEPSYKLHKSFKELLDLFEFVPFLGGSNVSDERLDDYIEVWKKTIDVQQHFNDLGLRIRNFAITVLGVVLSGTALSLKEGLQASLIGVTLPLAVLLVFVALSTWLAFYFMDRFWYHYLLIGAVKHGEKVERRLKDILPDIDLTHSISEASPIKIRTMNIHAARKMDIFYLSVAALLFILMISLILIPPGQNKSEPNFIINNIMPGANESHEMNDNSNAALHRAINGDIDAAPNALNTNAARNSNR
jgi:hypothetical protein